MPKSETHLTDCERILKARTRTYAFSVTINASGNTIDEARQTVKDWLSRAQDTAGIDGIEVQPFPIHLGEVVGDIVTGKTWRAVPRAA